MPDETRASVLDRFVELERRVAHLEYRDSRIIRLLDPNRHRENFFVLEYDLNADQIAGLCKGLEAAHKALEKGEPLRQLAFEKLLLPHIPKKEKPQDIPYNFIKALLMTFSQYSKVVEQYRREYNVPN